MVKLIIDGENALLGRLASYAAKQALQGKELVIVNSDKVIISGSKEVIIKGYVDKRRLGGTSMKGPYVPAVAYMILKRTIKGMLPKNSRGKDALKRIKCYNDVPKELESEKKIKAKVKDLESTRLEEIVKNIKSY